ncbi:hypothetical protein NL676_006498 [Syzygium grande]|nr:hypothetical protein NL676_006498 [Syzygium grande]
MLSELLKSVYLLRPNNKDICILNSSDVWQAKDIGGASPSTFLELKDETVLSPRHQRLGLPLKIQEIISGGFGQLFQERYPRLSSETYRFVSMCCEYGGCSLFPEYFNW